MRYLYPYFKEEKDEDRTVGLLVPFLGGILLGGLISNKNQGGTYPGYYQYPYNPYYTNTYIPGPYYSYNYPIYY